MKNCIITLNDKDVLNGLLVKEDEKHIVLKLSNGYNIGISRHRIKDIEYKEVHDKNELHNTRSHEIAHISQDKSLPKILILHTGGTIASKVDYETGAVTPKFSPEELVSMFPELKELARLECKLFRNIASDDIRFIHYNLIAEEIKEELKKDKSLKGIIITHGTDTMHYTSAALCFVFENLTVPVVLVGSQRSSDRGSSDAAINLISAVSFIANTSLKGVFICMHETMNDETCIILNGLNSKKLHSSRRDAFKQINASPIARVNYFSKEVEYLSEYPESLLNASGELKLHLFDEKLRIGIVKSHPNMFADELNVFSKYDGVILEGSGLGHFPITEMDEYTKENNHIRKALEELCKKIPVVMSLQTVYGSVNMNVYSPGRALVEMGIIGNNSSLSTETAFIKLAWLLSQKLDPKEFFMKDLRGEFSKSSE
jgi:glutamyl-tRNA(Gln) amidotransferase subunit D